MTKEYMEEKFDQVEGLVGTYPTGDNLRNAVFAVVYEELFYEPIRLTGRKNIAAVIKNVEQIARNYEFVRGTTQYLDANRNSPQTVSERGYSVD